MPIAYLEFEIQMHGLSIEDGDEVKRILLALKDAARNIHPDPKSNWETIINVDVELIRSAGILSVGELPGVFYTGEPHVPD